MSIDTKYLNMSAFENMTRENLASFAEIRGIEIDLSLPIEDLRIEVAKKDAMRFANKGLRVCEEKTPSLKELAERIVRIEKHLGLGK